MKRRRFLASSGLLMAAAGSGISATRPGLAGGRADGLDADVLVIGAGLSGLYASMLLEEQGLKVCVLEGRDRVGGRMFTLDKLPGRPEGGGSLLGPRYARALDLAGRLKVPLAAARPRTEPIKGEVALNIRGRTLRVEDWPASPMNTFPEALRHLTPWDVYFGELLKLNPFENLGDWRDTRFAAYDKPVQSILLERGFDPESLRILQSNSSYGNDFYTLTGLHLYHYFTWQKLQAVEGPRVNCADGNQRLPEAMARSLHGDVRTGTRVTGLGTSGGGVLATCEDGTRVRARVGVCTLPAPVLRYLAIDPPLVGQQAEAVFGLDYHKTYQIHFDFTRRFWEDDGLPPSLWTDGPVGRFNALKDVDGKSIVCFLAYANGHNAARLDRMSFDDAAAFVMRELERMRPSLKGALRPIRVWSMQNDPFSRGSYATWAPRQIPRFNQALIQPLGGWHFAGEHTALMARGFEGALESGERAALEVLAEA